VAAVLAIWLSVLAGSALLAERVPAAIGARSIASATNRHQHAEAVALRLWPDIALYRHVSWLGTQSARLAGPRWSTLVPRLEGTMPPGITVKTLDLNDTGASVAVKVAATAGAPALVPEWLSRLRRAGLEASTPSVTVDRSGATTFTTTFEVPRSFR
jgi:hypothetical protein